MRSRQNLKALIGQVAFCTQLDQVIANIAVNWLTHQSNATIALQQRIEYRQLGLQILHKGGGNICFVFLFCHVYTQPE